LARLHPVTRAQLAAVLGVSVRSVDRVEADGAIQPTSPARRGSPSLFDLAQAVPAYVAYRKRMGERPDAEARARRDRAQARFTELKIAQQERTLVPVEDVDLQWDMYVRAWALTVESIPIRAVELGIIALLEAPGLAAMCEEIAVGIRGASLSVGASRVVADSTD
jgi:phage terminase Nu1 subunit (DNA packaging protein)